MSTLLDIFAPLMQGLAGGLQTGATLGLLLQQRRMQEQQAKRQEFQSDVETLSKVVETDPATRKVLLEFLRPRLEQRFGPIPDTPFDLLNKQKQAAKRAGLSIQTIRRWIRVGTLPDLTSAGGKRWRIRATDLDQVVDRYRWSGLLYRHWLETGALPHPLPGEWLRTLTERELGIVEASLAKCNREEQRWGEAYAAEIISLKRFGASVSGVVMWSPRPSVLLQDVPLWIELRRNRIDAAKPSDSSQRPAYIPSPGPSSPRDVPGAGRRFARGSGLTSLSLRERGRVRGEKGKLPHSSDAHSRVEVGVLRGEGD